MSAGAGYSSPLVSSLTVLPSNTTFQAYFVTGGATVPLQWPVDNYAGNSSVVAELMNITPLGAGCVMQMPPATNTSLGEKTLLFNAGSFPFTIADATGATITTVGTGVAMWLALTDNTSTGGAWLEFQLGAGTSSANAAALAGAGLAANGPFLQQTIPVSGINSNYAVGPTDRAKLFNWSGGAGTITLPLAASVQTNFYFQVRNSGSGTLTLTCSGSDTLNGSASINFNVNDSAFIVTDGSNWYTIGLGSINTNIFNFQAVSLAGLTGTYVLPANLQGKVAYKFTGLPTGAVNVQVPTTVQQYWVDNETTGGFAIGVGTAAQIGGATQFNIGVGSRYILYCDGANVINASTASIAVPIIVSQGGTGSTTAPGALTNLGGTSLGVALFTAASTAAAQTSLAVLSASDSVAYALIM